MRGGIDRQSTQDVFFLYYDGQPRHYAPAANPENVLFQLLAVTTSPADLQGTAALSYRYKDPTKRDSSGSNSSSPIIMSRRASCRPPM